MRDRARRNAEPRGQLPTGFQRCPSGQPGATRLMPSENARDVGIAQPTRAAHGGFHGGVPSDAGGLPAPGERHAAAQPSGPRAARLRARVPPARGLDGENGVIRSLEQAIRRPNAHSKPAQRPHNQPPAPHQPTLIHGRVGSNRASSRPINGAYAPHCGESSPSSPIRCNRCAIARTVRRCMRAISSG